MQKVVASVALGALCCGPLGCYSTGTYLVDRCVADAAQATPVDGLVSSPAPIPAVRHKGGQAVWLRPQTLQWQHRVDDPADPTHVRVQARAYNPLVTAGSALTWVGTTISLVGTGIFFARLNQPTDALFFTGAGLAVSAEPLMWAGTILWLVGGGRRPMETPAPQGLMPPAPPPLAPFSPDPTQSLPPPPVAP